MKKVTIIFGDICFSDNSAIITHIDKICQQPIKQAEEFAESLLNTYSSYIIPEISKLNIFYN